MRASRDELPPTAEFEDPHGNRAVERAIEMGEMQGAFRFWPKGIDFTGPFVGLPHDKCPAPHWGYIISGRVRMEFVDHEEVYSAGDLFYCPAYHMPHVDEDTQLLEFTPLRAFREFEAMVASRTENAG